MKPGAFRIDAPALVQHRHRCPDATPSTWTVGLLTQRPTPEGANIHEIADAGYARQTLELLDSWPDSGSKRTLQNAVRITFEPAATWAEATHLGIFDGDKLIACGPLIRSAGHAGPTEVTFAATAIQMKFA